MPPDGIDMYYGNVGGVQLEAALDPLNDFGCLVAVRADLVRNTMLVVGKRIT